MKVLRGIIWLVVFAAVVGTAHYSAKAFSHWLIPSPQDQREELRLYR